MTTPIHIVRRYGRGIIGHVDHEGYRYVAVLGTKNDWACYRGTDQQPEWIVEHGDKQARNVAMTLFPFLTEWSYRP